MSPLGREEGNENTSRGAVV